MEASFIISSKTIRGVGADYILGTHMTHIELTKSLDVYYSSYMDLNFTVQY